MHFQFGIQFPVFSRKLKNQIFSTRTQAKRATGSFYTFAKISYFLYKTKIVTIMLMLLLN